MCRGHTTQILAIYNVSTFSKRNTSTEKNTPPSNFTCDIRVCCLQCLKKKDKRALDSSYPELSEGTKGRQKAAEMVINPRTAVLMSKIMSFSPLNFRSQMRKITS